MGKLTMFAIQLDKEQAVYHAGENVTGRVLVELAAPMKMRGLHIRFSGSAYVHWTKRHTTGSGKNRRTRTYHYRNSETYFDQNVVLFGKNYGDHAGENPIMAAGSYVYPFCFVLPPNLPSSFEGGIGWVRFQMEGIIDKPWKLDHKTKRPFTVLSTLDLNAVPAASMSNGNEGEKTICCCCCAQGPITGSLHVDHRGYVPGEQVRVRIDINNHSRRKIKDFTLKLTQSSLFYGYRTGVLHTKVIHEKVAEVKGPGLGRGDKETFPEVILTIPPLPPSDLVGCSIIDVRYFLTLEVNPSGMSTDLEVPIDVIIGTIPIRRAWSSHPTAAPWAPELEAATASAPTLDQFGAPPPSYAECMMDKVDVYQGVEGDEEDGGGPPQGRVYGDTMWAPSYTYYNFNYNTRYGMDIDDRRTKY